MPNTIVSGFDTINTTMTSANTEYSFQIPAGTVRFSIQTRDGTPFRIASVTGKVATPTAPYLTIRTDGNYNNPDNIQIGSTALTVYVGCGSAGKVVECVYWTQR